MDNILSLPAGPLADASLAVVRASTSEPIADHSIRSFLFARVLADHEGCVDDAAYDEQLLFAATVMHDGTRPARRSRRFGVEGSRSGCGRAEKPWRRRSRRRQGVGSDRPPRL